MSLILRYHFSVTSTHLLSSRIYSTFYIFHVGYYCTLQIQKRVHIISWISKMYSLTASIRYCLKAKQSMHVPFFVVDNSFQNHHYTTKRPKHINNSPHIDCDPILFRLT